MRLKVLTTACLVTALVLMLFFPLLMTTRPGPSQPRLARRAFAVKCLSYIGLTIVVVAGAGAGSLLVMRQVRREYREQAMRNIKEMVEGTLTDHQNRDRTDGDGPAEV